MPFLGSENVQIEGERMVIGPLARGLYIWVPVASVLKAMETAGFHLVPREMVQLIANLAQQMENADDSSSPASG